LVEPFLSGREFSIPVLGNPPVVLPIIQSDHSVLPEGMRHIDSLEVKWIFEEETAGANFVCPAKVSAELKSKIEKICLDTWNILGIVDFCRLDIRCDNEENPYFLEVNSPPGIIPPEVSLSYFPLSARAAGIDYQGLLKRIIYGALARYGIISPAELAEAIK
jgi:D-alanine-D-alanine ligase